MSRSEPSGAPRISELTRRNIFDALTVQRTAWAGRLADEEFLARIFDVEHLPSTDHRHHNAAGDVWQHRTLNPEDWPDDWVFRDGRFDLLRCDDDTFLRFLCEMLHPVVRVDPTEVESLLQLFNEQLAVDGYQIAEVSRLSGRPVYAARLTLDGPPASVQLAKESLNAGYMSQQITRLTAAINHDPELAIGTAKEFVETVCKVILRERNVKLATTKPELPELVKETARALKLTPADIPDAAKAVETIKRLLSNLGQVTQGLAELRNPYGKGHGKDGDYRGLRPRHAKLAVGAATTLALFLFETHKERR